MRFCNKVTTIEGVFSRRCENFIKVQLSLLKVVYCIEWSSKDISPYNRAKKFNCFLFFNLCIPIECYRNKSQKQELTT